MRSSPRFVLDTNVLVSRLILPNSVPAQAVRTALQAGQLVMSDAMHAEIRRVLSRSKFDRYLAEKDRQEFFRDLFEISELVPILFCIRACRDPKNNAILELAVNGSADFILTGDEDLLTLGSFHEIPIWTPAQYLAR